MLENKLLVAKPILVDPVFGGKAVLVSKYDKKFGAEGIILNGPIVGKVGYGETTKVKIDDDFLKKVLDESGNKTSDFGAASLNMGGPCKTNGIYMLHGYAEYSNNVTPKEEDEFELGGMLYEEQEENPDNSNVIMQGLYFGSPDVMMEIAGNNKEEEFKFRFFIGMSAWSPGQLEKEIESGAWDVYDASPELVFNPEALAKFLPKNEA